jgi:PAS domain-containing protein
MSDNVDGVTGQRIIGANGRRFRALLANVADMVTISDRDGMILYASPATEQV